MEGMNNHKYLEFIEARSPDELRDLLRSLSLPFEIIEIYEYSGKHIAWINCTRNLIKIDRKKIKES